jgi:hypothetical protein
MYATPKYGLAFLPYVNGPDESGTLYRAMYARGMSGGPVSGASERGDTAWSEFISIGVAAMTVSATTSASFGTC